MNMSLLERDFSADERKQLAAEGKALPDGSFPIVDSETLEAAITLAGNAHDPDAARRHIKKRAKELGLTSLIPQSWMEARRATPSASPPSPPSPSASSSSCSLRETELAEATTTTRDGRHIAEVTLIRGGTSRNGNHYPIEVLRAALPLFEGARAFVDHPSPGDNPERSIRDLVGSYRHVRLDETGGLAGQPARIRAELHLVPGNEWLFSLLQEAEQNPGLCGLSIDADGEVERAGALTHVQKLHRISSVDIVTRPSAGGQVERILQADRPAPPTGDGAPTGPSPSTAGEPLADALTDASSTSPVGAPLVGALADTPPATPPAASSIPQGARHMDPNAIQSPSAGAGTATLQEGHTQPAASAPTAPVQHQVNAPQPPDLAQLLEELRADRDRLQGELAKVTSVLAPASSQPPNPNKEISRLAEEIKRDRDLERSARVLGTQLREAQLPSPVEHKLRRQFEGRIVEASALELAIAEEKSVLAALAAAGHITGQGFEKPISAGMSEFDQVQAAMDALFDIYESDAARSVPRFSGIREAFRVVTGVDIGATGSADRPLREAFAQGLRAKVQRGNLTEAETILREADVTTATFSYLLGTSMNKRLLSDYQAWPSEWQKFSTIVGIKDFKQQDRIRLGAFGSLSTVAEDAAYTTLTLADTRAIYTPTKRGNLVQISRETIVNDDLYAIRQIPQKLAVAAAFTLAEFVYNLLAPNFGNIYDAHPLFDSVNHGNTGVVAANLNTPSSGAVLSSAALQTAVIKMRKQTNMASKPIGLKPRYLLVPPDLEFTAMTILKSAGLPGGNNNDINPMLGYAEPIVAPQLNSLTAGPASTTIWIAVADPRIIDTVEIGFVGGQANPVLLIQDMPLYGLNFTQDVISYKVRHEYGGAVVDYRGFYLGNN